MDRRDFLSWLPLACAAPVAGALLRPKPKHEMPINLRGRQLKVRVLALDPRLAEEAATYERLINHMLSEPAAAQAIEQALCEHIREHYLALRPAEMEEWRRSHDEHMRHLTPIVPTDLEPIGGGPWHAWHEMPPPWHKLVCCECGAAFESPVSWSARCDFCTQKWLRPIEDTFIAHDGPRVNYDEAPMT